MHSAAQPAGGPGVASARLDGAAEGAEGGAGEGQGRGGGEGAGGGQGGGQLAVALERRDTSSGGPSVNEPGNATVV